MTDTGRGHGDFIYIGATVKKVWNHRSRFSLLNIIFIMHIVEFTRWRKYKSGEEQLRSRLFPPRPPPVREGESSDPHTLGLWSCSVSQRNFTGITPHTYNTLANFVLKIMQIMIILSENGNLTDVISRCICVSIAIMSVSLFITRAFSFPRERRRAWEKISSFECSARSRHIFVRDICPSSHTKSVVLLFYWHSLCICIAKKNTCEEKITRSTEMCALSPFSISLPLEMGKCESFRSHCKETECFV